MSIQSSTGVSSNKDPKAAAHEIIDTWSFAREGNQAPNIVICYTTSRIDSQKVCKEFRAQYPQTTVLGCTTAGEFTELGHRNDTVSAMAIQSDEIQWHPVLIKDINTVNQDQTRSIIQKAWKDMGVNSEELDPKHFFSLLLVDGLSLCEERFTDYLADALEGIPLIGGSAGDDLEFKQTMLFLNDQVYSNSAIVLIGQTKTPFKIFKHQHFKRSDQNLVITKADPSSRTVYEFNGMAAADVYAGELGFSNRGELTDDVVFMNPVQFCCDGAEWVRSIQKINDDGSITFYCAIEEGMVVNLSSHNSMAESLKTDFSNMNLKSKAEVFLGFNCILRRLEAETRKCDQELAQQYQTIAKHTIGFDTYGEQLNGLHINQTLVGILLYAAS
jgi:hypothetical protein